MKVKIKYEIRKIYIMKKTQKNYYKNKTVHIETIKNYLDQMLN